MAAIRKPFVPLFLGSSLTTGRLASFDVSWVAKLDAELRTYPEAVGPYEVINAGKGSQNSAWGVTQIDLICAYQPSHILMEGFAINDCIDFGSGPAISQAAHIANITTMVAAFQARIPGVDITIQTMSPVSAAGAPTRPLLANYYADELTTAAALGVHSLDHYSAWVAGFGANIPDWLTNEFDGLHPRFLNGLDTYLYPSVNLWARQKMATLWGLSAPAPIAAPVTDCDVLLIPGGGAGGDALGGGGGAGRPFRYRGLLANLLGAVTVGAAGVAGSGLQGGTGGDTAAGGRTAKGGGGGGTYSTVGTSTGKDGSCGGGAGSSSANARRYGGNAIDLGGNYGGASGLNANDGGGGGGGAQGAGADATVNGGQGGAGWLDDVPGDPQTISAGAPGGAFSGVRPAYQAGSGPTALGGGGRGGGPGGSTTGPADNGGPGAAYIWYPTGPVHTGGTISTSGGKTVHKFTASGAFG